MKSKSLTLFLLIALSIPVFSSCARHQNAESFYFGPYSEAEALYNRQQYEKAIQKYQAYIDENPEGNLSVIARYYMGRSYAAIGKKDEARALFQKIVKEHADLVWANFSQSQLKELDKTSEPAKKS